MNYNTKVMKVINKWILDAYPNFQSIKYDNGEAYSYHTDWKNGQPPTPLQEHNSWGGFEISVQENLLVFYSRRKIPLRIMLDDPNCFKLLIKEIDLEVAEQLKE